MLLATIVWLLATFTAWQMYRIGRWSHEVLHDLLALGLLAVATAGFFWRLLFTSGIWMPAGGGDLVSFLFPVYRFIARSLHSGDYPLWNPYLYGGAPLVGDNQSALFYPLNLAAFVLKPGLTYRAMEWLSVLHFFVAGACAYLGLRYMDRRTLEPWAAIVGATAFMFSDLFVTHFGNLNMIACAAWFPLVFCLFGRALEEDRPALAAAAGTIFAVAALAGHIQPLLLMTVALVLYFVIHVRSCWRKGVRHILRAALIAFITFGLAVGLAAPALLPSLEMSSLTLRAQLTYQEASQYSLPPAALIGLLVPGIFGRGPGGYWAPWPRVEVGYAGILTLVLAGLALWLRRNRVVRFLALLAVVSLFLALGQWSILHRWLYRWVPGFDLVRAPARFVFLLDFALAGLAALCLDTLMRPLLPLARRALERFLRLSPSLLLGFGPVLVALAYTALRQSQSTSAVIQRLHAAAGGLALAFALFAGSLLLLFLHGRGRMRSAVFGTLAFCLLAADLASLGSSTELERNDPTAGFSHSAAVGFLKSDSDVYRIDTRTEVWDVWQPDLSLLNGIQDVWGIYNPLVLADYNAYWEGLGSRSTPLYDFLNAKYIVAHKDVELDWDKFELVFEGDPGVNIYRNTNVLPRAYVVHDVWAVTDQNQAFAAIHRPDFDPSRTVVLERATPLSTVQRPASPAIITSYSNNQIRLTVPASETGYLVMSEVYYPGWRCEVDGKPAAILRANYAFRAVALEAGSHEVRFLYEPLSFRLGLALSLTCALGVVSAGVRQLIITRRRRMRNLDSPHGIA